MCYSLWYNAPTMLPAEGLQISDNEIYLLIKYIKSFLWRVAKRLSYIEVARCLKVNIVLDTALRKANDTRRGIRWTLTDRLEDLDYADVCWQAHTFNDIKTKLQRLHHETADVGLKINKRNTHPHPQQPTIFSQ